VRQWPGRQRHASRQASLQHGTTGHTVEMWGTCLRRARRCQHRDSSL
jgi:hypothetical protein